MNKEQLISEMLCLPPTAIEYHISKNLVELFPDKAMIESDGGCSIEAYANAQHCTLTKKTFTFNQMNTYWRAPEPALMRWHNRSMPMPMFMNGFDEFGMQDQAVSESDALHGTRDTVKRAWLEVVWQGHTLDVIMIRLDTYNMSSIHHWILADTEDIARA